MMLALSVLIAVTIGYILGLLTAGYLYDRTK